MKKTRYTIGLLAYDLTDSNDHDLFHGLTDYSVEQNFNLIHFNGGRLRDQNEYNIQGNILYNFIGKSNIDALIIWASVIGCFVTPDELQSFCEKYSAVMPVVSIGTPIANIPSVLADSYSGMYEMIDHLINVHGRKKIVFIQGPRNHFDSSERFRAYKDALDKNRIPYDPLLVSENRDWAPEHGVETIRKICDEHRIAFDAVAGASLKFIIGALLELEKRRINIPGDVSVIAFDERPECRANTPSLTTAPIMLYERGQIAAKLLLDKLSGKIIPEITTIPCKPIYRQSCGCKNVLENLSISPTPESPDAHTTIIPDYPALAQELINGISRLLPKGIVNDTEQWDRVLATSFIADFSEASHGQFHVTLGSFLEKTGKTGISALRLDEIVRICRPRPEWNLSASQITRCLHILQHALVLIKEFEAKEETKKWLELHKYTETLIHTGHSWTTIFNIEELADILARELPSFDIPSFYLCLYNQKNAPVYNEARLILAYTRGERKFVFSGDQEIFFSAEHLIPKEYLPAGAPMTLVTEPLYYKENQIGYAVFEAGPKETSVYVLLRMQLSSIIWGTMILEKQIQSERTLELQKQELARSNRELEQFAYIVAHDLQEPLRKISVFSELIAREQTDISKGYYSKIINATDLMREMIRDLLAYSRVKVTAEDLKTVDLSLIVREVLSVLDLVIKESNAKITVEKLPVIKAEPIQMFQLFQNILSNSLKFHQENIQPQITISLGPRTKNSHAIIFEDNGIGIDAQYHDRIFGVFQRLHTRTQYEGSGIGLAICKRIVEHHNGSITIESELNKGTKLIVTLPSG
ncbi:MAG: substrate-binding domain-containing protein [Spirochaetales bacterium]|nr:substrate-binding domain-containing protein [Spirochaetales bacterium]